MDTERYGKYVSILINIDKEIIREVGLKEKMEMIDEKGMGNVFVH